MSEVKLNKARTATTSREHLSLTDKGERGQLKSEDASLESILICCEGEMNDLDLMTEAMIRATTIAFKLKQ